MPSEDYSRQPPGSAASLREGRETLYAQQRSKKKIMETKDTTIEGLPAITALLVEAAPAAKPVFKPAKFIIISLLGREEVVAFAFETQHADKLAELQKQHGDVKAISAGFFMGSTDRLWVGGESITLDLAARPRDTEIIRDFLANGGAK